MIRKSFVFLLVAVMLCGSAAGMEITLTDMAENRLQITGTADSGSYVTAMILSPQAESDEDETAIVYFRAIRAQNGTYCFDAVMPEMEGGIYTFAVQWGDNDKEIVYQSFYPIEKKLEYAEILSEGTITSAVIEEVAKVFSLENYPPYVQAGPEKTAQKLMAVRETVSGFATDVEKTYEILVFSMTAAALEGQCPCMVQEDGALNYEEVLGIAENTLYAEYPQSLSAAGVSAVNEMVRKAGILSAEQGNAAFEEAMLLHLIKNYKDSGSGHVGTYLNTYSALYTKCGFDLSLLKQVSDLTAVYTKLKNSSAASISALAAEFPAIVEQVKNSSTPSTGSSSSSSSSGRGAAGSGTTVGGSNSTDSVNYINPDTNAPYSTGVFSDMETVLWAKEAVETLAERGVIAGKGGGLFAPNDEITRQEFVKILVGAFGLTAQDAECLFTDVTAEWAMQPVAVAAALGIVNGTGENMFSPEEQITREDGAAMLARAAAVMGVTLEESGYRFEDDGLIADYAKSAVYRLNGAGIISGKGADIFDPKASMTRAEAAKMIYGLSIMR